MNTEVIGTNAGLPYGLPLTQPTLWESNRLKKSPNWKDKEVFAAIGWLAREGKIAIDVDPEDEKEFAVSLVQG